MKKLILALLLVGLVPTNGTAREGEDSWDNLKQLRVGQKIEVIDMNLKTLKGTLTAVSDEAISFLTQKGEVSLGRTEVFRVSDREHSKRGRNALIGAAILGGIVAVPMGIGWVICSNEGGGSGCAGRALGIIAAGAGAGAGLGAAAPSYRTIYRAKKIRAQKSH